MERKMSAADWAFLLGLGIGVVVGIAVGIYGTILAVRPEGQQ